MTAAVIAGEGKPFTVGVEAAKRFNEDLSGFVGAWWMPMEQKFGGDAGLRIRDNLDLFVGGWGDYRGNWEIESGVRWSF